MAKASALARVERKLRSLDKWMPKPVPKGADFSQYADDPVGFFRDVLKIEVITDDQVKMGESVRDNPETNVQASHGAGKCIAKNEKILLSTGLEVLASSLVGLDFTLLTLDNGSIKNVAARAEWNRLESVYEITTETGRRIIRNSNHPLWAGIKWSRSGAHPIIDVKEWASIGQISSWLSCPPDYKASKFTSDGWDINAARSHSVVCAVPKEIPIFGEKSLPEYEIKILAYLIGDGGLTGGAATFTQQKGAQLDEFKHCVEQMGCVLVKRSGKYGYCAVNPFGKRHSKQGKISLGLFNNGDFSCDRHISVAQLIKSGNTAWPTVYDRLKVLGIKPVPFYNKSYISHSEANLYKLFETCLELSRLSRIKGSAKGNYAEALRILQDKSEGLIIEPVDLGLLEAQKVEAIRQVKERQGIQPGARRNGVLPNAVVEMLKRHGLMGKGSAEKTIPSAVFELPKPQLALFLSRLFSTDGWACVSKPQGKRLHGKAEIGFCSISQEMIEQIQRLLLRFGIIARISRKPKVNAWVLTIGDSEMLLKFSQEIGIFGKEEAVRRVVERAKIAQADKRSQSWRSLAAPDCTVWEKIKSIKKLDPEMTVAIEVPEYHHYLTNFWEHNSFFAACIVLWWVFAVGGLAITTAPTESQVKQILWSEIRKLYQRHKAEFGGKCDILQLKLTESARAYGFTARNYDSNSFQGKHAEKMLLIQDEACGITQEIDDGFESCLTGSSNRGLRIGNPIDPQTPFEKACKRSHIRIPAWNHPNVAWAYRLDPDGIHRLPPEIKIDICDGTGAVKPQAEWPSEYPRDVIPGAVSVGWIEKARLRGENSAFWLSRVEGLFPVDSGASIVPQSWFLAARARYDSDPVYWDEVAAKQPWRHGLDVGDGGDDNAIASWRGPVLYAVECEPTRGDRLDTARAATLGRKRLEKSPGWCAVDQVGVGAGTLTMLLEQELQAFGINWGHGAEEKDEFLNEKAEQYWALREAFRTEDVAIAPLGQYEDMVMEDLSGTWYEETSAGKVRIEDKAKTRKRLGRSPNAGDAVCLGFGHTPIIEFSSSGKKQVGDTIDDFLNL